MNGPSIISVNAMLILSCPEWCAQNAAVRGSIRTVQVKGKDSGWLSMKNDWGAAWEIPQAPQPPLDFRFVDDSGSEVNQGLTDEDWQCTEHAVHHMRTVCRLGRATQLSGILHCIFE